MSTATAFCLIMMSFTVLVLVIVLDRHTSKRLDDLEDRIDANERKNK